MAEHTHPDPGRLVFGCTACYERAVQDQLDAEVGEARLRHVTVHFTLLSDQFDESDGEPHAVQIRLRWPTGWEYDDVANYYLTGWSHRPEISDAIDRQIAVAMTSQGGMVEVDEVRLEPGRWIAEPKPDWREGQPTMFD